MCGKPSRRNIVNFQTEDKTLCAGFEGIIFTLFGPFAAVAPQVE
jgi:hypothetical protein